MKRDKMMDNEYTRQVREAYPHLDALIDLDVPDHILQDYTDGVLNPEHLARILVSDAKEYEHDRRLRNQFE